MAGYVALNNGDRISGKIVNTGNPLGLMIINKYTGQIVIPWDDVADYSGKNETAPQNTEIKTASLVTAESVASDIVPSEDIEDTGYEWSGRVNVGANLLDGNNNVKEVNADTEWTAEYDVNRFIFGGEVNWSESEGEQVENDQLAFGEYNRFFTEKWFAGTGLRLRRDPIQELDLRSTLRVFSGYQFYDQDDLSLSVRPGLSYIRESFANSPDQNDLGLSFGLDYEQKFFEQALTLYHNNELNVPFATTDAFLFESDTGLRVPIADQFTGSLQLDFDWDNAPAEGVREEDIAWRAKLGYEW